MLGARFCPMKVDLPAAPSILVKEDMWILQAKCTVCGRQVGSRRGRRDGFWHATRVRIPPDKIRTQRQYSRDELKFHLARPFVIRSKSNRSTSGAGLDVKYRRTYSLRRQVSDYVALT